MSKTTIEETVEDFRSLYCSLPDKGNANISYYEHLPKLESFLRTALTTQKEEIMKEVAKLDCPEAYGFEGRETFPDCGECIVCEAKKLTPLRN